jgi:hypothetical protein
MNRLTLVMRLFPLKRSYIALARFRLRISGSTTRIAAIAIVLLVLLKIPTTSVFRRSVKTRSQAISTNVAFFTYCSIVYPARPSRAAILSSASRVSRVCKGSGISNKSSS